MALSPHARRLTPRQLEIFTLLAKGLTNQEIAALLGISPNTVRNHVAAVFETLGVGNRTEAAFAYLETVDRELPLRASALPPGPPSGGETAGPAVRSMEALRRRPAIALLPLSLHARDGDHEFLAAGLIEDLQTRLAAWPWLPMIAFDSSRRYADAPLQVIRRELGAGYVVTGALRVSGREATLNLHVVDTVTEQTIGSESERFGPAEGFAGQDQLARALVARIAPTLLDFESRVAVARPAPSGAEAWRLTCLGMGLLSRRKREDVDRALAHFDGSLAIDPDFGLTWYGRVWAHTECLWQQWAPDPEATLARLRVDGERYLALEGRGAQACIVRGLMALFSGDLVTAEAGFAHACLLNTSSARALFLHAQCLGLLGRYDACIAALDDALRLNPRSGSSALYMSVIGVAHFLAGRPLQTLAWCERSLALQPDQPNVLLVQAAACVHLGRHREARALVRRQQHEAPHFRVGTFVRNLATAAPPQQLERFRLALETIGAL